MKKGIITADWHIDYHNRMEDTKTRINEVVDFAIENKVDFFAFVGDAYKNCRPMPVEQEIFQSAQRRLKDKGIYVIDVVGNHDYPNSDDQIHCLSEWKTLGIDGITVVDKPSYVQLCKPDEDGQYFALCMPHLPKSIVGKRKYAEVYKEEWDKLWDEYQDATRHVANGPNFNTMFLSHVLISGSKLGSTDWAISQSDGVNIKDILDGKGKDIQMCFFGDVHKAQKLAMPPFAGYCGSIERIDFGEIADKKGFFYVEMAPKGEKVEFKQTRATVFVELVGTIETADPMKEIVSWISQVVLKNAIVKVVITATEEQAKQIDEEKVRELLIEGGVKSIASYQVEVISVERVRNENVNENANPVDALKEWVGMQSDITDDKKAKIIKIGEKILQGIK